MTEMKTQEQIKRKVKRIEAMRSASPPAPIVHGDPDLLRSYIKQRELRVVQGVLLWVLGTSKQDVLAELDGATVDPKSF